VTRVVFAAAFAVLVVVLWFVRETPLAHPMLAVECVERWATEAGELRMTYVWDSQCGDNSEPGYVLIVRQRLTRAEVIIDWDFLMGAGVVESQAGR
jgi:hypothetical protein